MDATDPANEPIQLLLSFGPGDDDCAFVPAGDASRRAIAALGLPERLAPGDLANLTLACQEARRALVLRTDLPPVE